MIGIERLCRRHALAISGGIVSVHPPQRRASPMFTRSSLHLVGGGAALLVVILVLGVKLGLAATVAYTGTTHFLRGRRRFQRIEAFERDYPTLLTSLASSVRAGLDPLAAFTAAGALFPKNSPLRREVEAFSQAIDAGEEEIGAMRRFGVLIGHPDVVLLQNAYLLSRREGASLAECLHRLARVTRQRQSFRRKIRGAVAMQRLSAFGIGACAGVIGVFQCIANPQGIELALSEPRGFMALSLGGALIMGGLAWMVYLVRARI